MTIECKHSVLCAFWWSVRSLFSCLRTKSHLCQFEYDIMILSLSWWKTEKKVVFFLIFCPTAICSRQEISHPGLFFIFAREPALRHLRWLAIGKIWNSLIRDCNPTTALTRSLAAIFLEKLQQKNTLNKVYQKLIQNTQRVTVAKLSKKAALNQGYFPLINHWNGLKAKFEIA